MTSSEGGRGRMGGGGNSCGCPWIRDAFSARLILRFFRSHSLYLLVLVYHLSHNEPLTERGGGDEYSVLLTLSLCQSNLLWRRLDAWTWSMQHWIELSKWKKRAVWSTNNHRRKCLVCGYYYFFFLTGATPLCHTVWESNLFSRSQHYIAINT